MIIKYSDNSKKFIRKLAKVHGNLEKAAANTLNQAAEYVEDKYKKGIKQDYLLRDERYTLGAIQIVKAHAIRKSGQIRPISNINAILGVRKMKGGKEHYLTKQEEGATVRGQLKGKVPVPLDTARIGGSHGSKVKPGYRLNKAEPQTLTLSGKPFGHNDNFTLKQRWGILYDIQRGKHKPEGWDLSKPFIFTSLKRGLGVFVKAAKNRIRWIRSLSESSIRIQAHRTMEKATRKLTDAKMDNIFLQEAKRFVR